MKSALAIGLKEFRQIVRDARTLAIVLFMPFFLLLLYGYALNFDIRHVRLAVQDRDHSATSRAIVSAFVNSGYFDLVATIDHEREIRALVDSDRARAVLVIPEATARRLESGRDAAVQVIVNGDNANTANAVVGYANAIVRGVSVALRAERLGVAVTAPIALEPRVWFNPELRSTIFLVPGLIAFIATFTAVVLTALAIVREKEFGTMEQIRMAPIGTLSYVVGKALPYLLLSFVSSMSILLAGMLVFDMPMRGSWPLLMSVTALFLVAALGFGLFISTIANSQQFAFQVALITSFLPTIVLSGFIFPIANMPVFLQYVTYIVPARYYLSALRGIVLKGVGVAEIWPQVGALLVFATLVLGLASVRLARERE
ncbi:MAG: ABC-type transport system permease component [Acidobacteria bacterium]|nr:ABC-type transport system permease component [Acidobacteriota bacterium]